MIEWIAVEKKLPYLNKEYLFKIKFIPLPYMKEKEIHSYRHDSNWDGNLTEKRYLEFAGTQFEVGEVKITHWVELERL